MKLPTAELRSITIKINQEKLSENIPMVKFLWDKHTK